MQFEYVLKKDREQETQQPKVRVEFVVETMDAVLYLTLHDLLNNPNRSILIPTYLPMLIEEIGIAVKDITLPGRANSLENARKLVEVLCHGK